MSGFLTGVAGAAAAALLLTAGPALALDPPPVDPPTVPPRPSPTVEAPAAAPARQVLFNYPTPGAADMTISERLVELIDATPAGESISMSYFVIQPGHPVIDSLLRAHGRGVNVRVVLDSGDGQKAKKDAAWEYGIEHGHIVDAAVARQDSWQGCSVSPEGESLSWEDHLLSRLSRSLGSC